MEELYCLGCGIKLQCIDSSKEGYVDQRALNRSFILCKRCYQLKHYGIFEKSEAVKNSINLIHQEAKKDDLVVLIADCALVYNPLNRVLKELNSFKNVILVANRYDLYKSMVSEEKCLEFLNKQAKINNINFQKIFLLNNNIDEIFNYIDDNSIDRNVYLVGLENAGKTTFVNLILNKIASEDKIFLTNSKYPGTTIDLVKINLDDNHYLIDSPGIKSKGNILNYLEIDFIKKLNLDKKLKQNMFILNPYQSLIISNIIKFDFISGNKQTIIFTSSNQLEITRSKYENSKDSFNHNINYLKLKSNNVKSIDDLVKRTIKIQENGTHDIIIEGIGFFSVMSGTYDIYCFKDVNISVRKSFIRR